LGEDLEKKNATIEIKEKRSKLIAVD